MSDSPARSAGKPRPTATFVTGSILRHILVMTGTGAIGLMAVFLGDLANVIFLSWLNDVEVLAAVGYASSLMFLAIASGIGLAIAVTATVAPAIGAGRREEARRLATHGIVFSVAVAIVLTAAIVILLPTLLTLLGAKGRAHALAVGYGRVVITAMPLLVIGMSAAAVLRSLGDPTRAMHITLGGAVVAVLLDPVLIFWMGLALDGAALAAVASRIAVAAIGLYGLVRIHNALGPFELSHFSNDTRLILVVAVPAVLTQLATPFANAYMTAAIATYGDSAVAGWTVIGRIYPVAFGAIFALSGSIGPIIGQNLGARNGARLEEAVIKSVFVTGAFTLFAWALLAATSSSIVQLFAARGEAADLIVLFCRWLSPLFFFLGILFIANAAFNTLGKPGLSTALNWARATLGTVPLVSLGGWLAGATGALVGFMASGVVFGILAVMLCLKHVRRIERDWSKSTNS